MSRYGVRRESKKVKKREAVIRILLIILVLLLIFLSVMFGCSSYINERREYDDIIKNAMLDEVPEINSFDDLKRVVDKMDRETQAVSTAINTLELTPGQISFIKAKLTQIRDDINKILDADIDDPPLFVQIFHRVADDVVDHPLHLLRIGNHHHVLIHKVKIAKLDSPCFQFQTDQLIQTHL